MAGKRAAAGNIRPFRDCCRASFRARRYTRNIPGRGRLSWKNRPAAQHPCFDGFFINLQDDQPQRGVRSSSCQGIGKGGHAMISGRSSGARSDSKLWPPSSCRTMFSSCTMNSPIPCHATACQRQNHTCAQRCLISSGVGTAIPSEVTPQPMPQSPRVRGRPRRVLAGHHTQVMLGHIPGRKRVQYVLGSTCHSAA